MPSSWDQAYRQFLLQQRAEGKRPETLKWHEYQLPRFICWCKERDIATIEEWRCHHGTQFLTWLREQRHSKTGKPLSEWSIHTAVRSIKVFLHWLIEEGELPDNATRELTVKTPDDVPKPFAESDLSRLWSVVQRGEGWRRRHDEALLAFLLDTGCRVGEVVSLNVGDLDLEEGTASVSGKNGGYVVVFSVKTAAKLARWERERRAAPGEQAFFVNSRGRRWTRNGVLQWCYRIGKLADVPDCHPHRFRDTFATILAREGYLFAAHAQLGHATLDMTRRYADISNEALRRAHEQAQPFTRVMEQRIKDEPLIPTPLPPKPRRRPASTGNPGEKNGRSVLSETQVRQIKQRIAAGDNYSEIARDYPVSRVAVGKIAKGQAWAHVRVD
jgi:site-specific recombinase XerD